MKRNQRTQAVAARELTPLTEYILGQMGPEGEEIRQRLQGFYRQRVCDRILPEEQKREPPV
jgi:hypothetical protein